MPFDLKYLSSWRRPLSRRGQARVGPWPWSKTWEKAIERREVKGKDDPQVFLNNARNMEKPLLLLETCLWMDLIMKLLKKSQAFLIKIY